MRPMTTWHRLGDKPELLLQVPTVFKLDRWSVAVFHHDGRFRAIGNACNHKGGPLSEGRLHGEFVMCPWHAWEYSVVTGKGPEGYDEEQVPVFADRGTPGSTASSRARVRKATTKSRSPSSRSRSGGTASTSRRRR